MSFLKNAVKSEGWRTAFIACKDFLEVNGERINIFDKLSQAKIMQGIRENFYKNEEINKWLRYGKTKQFKR